MKLYTKSELLNQLRTESEKAYQNLMNKNSAKSSHKSNAQFMNNFITKQRNKFITNNIDNIDNPDDTVLNNLMLIYYVSYIVMLEYRHKCWPYEYMAFSRRIGELWEPFCKLPFQYSKKDLEEYKPKTFAYVKNEINENFLEYIDKLNISEEEHSTLKSMFESIWGYVDSGAINLNLDLHFKQNDIYYDIDYKSGFSSNEKGNTNRLLMVASVYNQLESEHKTLIFVRQEEADNNHYLQTLKNSGLWEVYCAGEVYKKTEEFTGFNIAKWMIENMDWESDITPEFRDYLQTYDLLKYLTW